MGFDLCSIPVRLGAAPMRRIREDSDAWKVAVVHPPFAEWTEGEAPPAISQALLSEVPDVMGWDWYFSDRSFERAEYLLDPGGFRNFRDSDERERSLPFRVIQGDEPFAKHAKGSQGVPWRCSSAAFLKQAVSVIDAINPATARREFSCAEMVALHVYKSFHLLPDDLEFERILRNLRRLAAYYRHVSDRGLDLIVEVD